MTDQRKVTIDRAAAIRQAWEGVGNNAEAARRLRDMMAADPDLYREILRPFEQQAAEMAVARKRIADRAYVWNRPAAPDIRVGALARANAATILDNFRLDTGLPLGDATKVDLIEAAGRYSARAEWNADKARFLGAIAARVTGKKTVRACLSAAEVEELKNA